MKKISFDKANKMIGYYLVVTLLISFYVWLQEGWYQGATFLDKCARFLFIFYIMLLWPYYLFLYLDDKYRLLISWWQNLKN